MGSRHNVLLLTLVCASLATGLASRELSALQCPSGCKPNKCIQDKTTGRFRCTKCLTGMVVIKSSTDQALHGTCGCRAGRTWSNTGGTEDDVFKNKPQCSVCTKGSYCPGGKPTDAIETKCPGFDDGRMTTKNAGAASKWQCVEKAGYGYAIDNSEPSASLCTGNTYNPGFAKKPCTACPTGFKIETEASQGTVASYHTSISQCLVPPGYFLRGPGEAAPCPQGEYKEGYDTAKKCDPCPYGTTTDANTNHVLDSPEFCNTLKPGFYAGANSLEGTSDPSLYGSDYYIVADAKLCPQKNWCPGGVPAAAYTGAATGDDYRVYRCASTTDGSLVGTFGSPMWTKGIGATAKEECLVPPGLGVNQNTGAIEACPSPYYREGWVTAADTDNHACVLCASGNGVVSEAKDKLKEYHQTDGSEAILDVIASVSSCKLLPGWGMYQSGGGAYKTLVCNSDSYGAPNPIYGRSVSPCRACPTNMKALTGDLATTTDPDISNYVPPIGQDPAVTATAWTSPEACKTQAGFGYDGIVSTQCAAGYWNAAGNRKECKKCPYGMTTFTDNGGQQDEEDDCAAAPGFEELAVGVVTECKVGTFADAIAGDPYNRPCTECEDNRDTPDTQSDAETDCTRCKPGYGKDDSAAYDDACVDCSLTSNHLAKVGYGPADREKTACVACPEQSEGFRFLYLGTEKLFKSNPVIKSASKTQADCLADFAQIENGLWYLAGADETTSSGASPLRNCVDSCTNSCMFATFKYTATSGEGDQGLCYLATAAGTGDGLAFKAVPSGDTTGAASKTISSGLYTIWQSSPENAAKIGVQGNDVADAHTVDKCFDACDGNAQCAGVHLVGYAPGDADVTSCKLITGISDPTDLASYPDPANQGQFLDKTAFRSLTRVSVANLYPVAT